MYFYIYIHNGLEGVCVCVCDQHGKRTHVTNKGIIYVLCVCVRACVRACVCVGGEVWIEIG